ncbi:MAG: CatB-related O-acetyltransferase [Thermodesulfobacteriota bacterium]|jgi:acetyltransferase-like isoleucine patch superfamily enzyme
MNQATHKGESRLLDGLLSTLYRLNNRCLRRLIREILRRSLEAELYSKTLRAIYSKYRNVKVGMYSYGCFHANLPPGTEVGRYTSVPRNLRVIDASHPITHKSSHPFFFNPDLGYVPDPLIEWRKKLIIGNDVYIGLDVTVLPTVTSIGDGAVIAAGSVVIKDVPPFAVVGGNPAKLIKFRFSTETMERIVSSRWWEKDIEELKMDEEGFAGFLKPLG